MIDIVCDTDELRNAALNLSKDLNIPLNKNSESDYSLVLANNGLSLQKNNSSFKPLKIDFLHGKSKFRLMHSSLKKEALARAMGLKNKTKPKIVDATAGLGRDSFILASLGFEIILLERSPIIFALIKDGIQRAKEDILVGPIVNRLHLVLSDSILWLQNLKDDEKPDIIYLDPMFPERTKSALVKKDMQIFHDILGEDMDADKLLKTALACATKRVVVKRPRLSRFLAELKPTFSHTEKSCRFDVYLVGC